MPNNGHSGFIHERAINLARRWSVQNENDLMQVSFKDLLDTCWDDPSLANMHHRFLTLNLCLDFSGGYVW
jgi:hypothetical protein